MSNHYILHIPEDKTLSFNEIVRGDKEFSVKTVEIDKINNIAYKQARNRAELLAKEYNYQIINISGAPGLTNKIRFYLEEIEEE